MLGTGLAWLVSAYEFRYGTPSFDEFPMDAWRTLTKRVLDYPPQDLLGYGPTEGLPALRESLARYLQRSRGVRCDAGQVLVVSNTAHEWDYIPIGKDFCPKCKPRRKPRRRSRTTVVLVNSDRKTERG